jgi:hypothetical protein
MRMLGRRTMADMVGGCVVAVGWCWSGCCSCDSRESSGLVCESPLYWGSRPFLLSLLVAGLGVFVSSFPFLDDGNQFDRVR